MLIQKLSSEVNYLTYKKCNKVEFKKLFITNPYFNIMVKALIHHAEIGLKKGNFSFFEKRLVENIRNLAEKNKIKLKKISRGEKRILAEFDSKEEKVSE